MLYTHVDKPIKIGSIELKNRIVRTAHATLHGKGLISDDLIAYHEARARGGAALSILEVGSVHYTSPFSLRLFDPAVEGGMRRLTDRMRPHGMKVFQQLWHGGHHAVPNDGSPPWSASDIPSAEVGIVPLPMTKMMIDTIVEAYAERARRCKEWGLDGVDVHCAHGYLPAQFLSANINKREDDYGGSFENRARFMLEVLAAIRSAVPRDFVVGIRVGSDLIAGGVGVEENLLVTQMLEERGLIDYVNLSVGNYNILPKIIAGMNEPAGYQMPTSVPISHNVKVPSMIIGRYRTLEEADQAIRNGDGDMVGLVRAMIADPDLVVKSLRGEADRVRPCIGCNQGCVANAQFPWQHMECAVNPGTGHELRRGDHMIRSTATPRTVLVIGGGPAGMEAARVAALRGHRVILAEADSRLGGKLRVASRAPTRQSIMDIVIWLEAEIYRLGVEVRLSTFLDAQDIYEIGAAAVIVATGASERMDGIQASHPGQPIKGIDRGNMISSVELFMTPPAGLGENAVVIDDVGHYEGLAAAEHLINKGLKVTYITRLRSFAPLLQGTNTQDPFLMRVKGKPFHWMIRTRVISIGPREVIVGPVHLMADDEETQRLPADTVVFISSNRPNREIFDALSGGNIDVYRVGDANSPRFIEAAIREGHLAAMAI